MKVRLNKMIFDEKSKHKKEVMLNLFESLQTNVISILWYFLIIL